MTIKTFIAAVVITIILLIPNNFPVDIPTDAIGPGQKTEKAVVVSNPKDPKLKMRIVFEEDLTIGEAEGNENYMFGSTISFTTDEEGYFYVADSGHRIQKYDPNGKYILTIGRTGQGPGEFQSLSQPHFDKNHCLYVYDYQIQRVSFFDKSGNYLRQILMPERYFYNPQINSKGRIVAIKWNQVNEDNIQKRISRYCVFDEKLNLIEELYEDVIIWPRLIKRDEPSIIDYLAQRFTTQAFRPGVSFTVAKNELIYLGYPSEYKINIFSPEGKLVKIITRDYDPIPVSEKEKQRFVKTTGERIRSVSEEIKNKAHQRIKFPKYKPAYQSFTLMENGWLVVIVDYIGGEYTLFDIFDQEGKYISQFKTEVPAGGAFSWSLFFKNGKAYSLAIEDDYNFIKRYNFRIQEFIDGKWVGRN